MKGSYILTFLLITVFLFGQGGSESGITYIEVDEFSQDTVVTAKNLDNFIKELKQREIDIVYRRSEVTNKALQPRTEYAFPHNGILTKVDGQYYQTLTDAFAGIERGFSDGREFYICQDLGLTLDEYYHAGDELQFYSDVIFNDSKNIDFINDRQETTFLLLPNTLTRKTVNQILIPFFVNEYMNERKYDKISGLIGKGTAAEVADYYLERLKEQERSPRRPDVSPSVSSVTASENDIHEDKKNIYFIKYLLVNSIVSSLEDEVLIDFMYEYNGKEYILKYPITNIADPNIRDIRIRSEYYNANEREYELNDTRLAYLLGLYNDPNVSKEVEFGRIVSSGFIDSEDYLDMLDRGFQDKETYQKALHYRYSNYEDYSIGMRFGTRFYDETFNVFKHELLKIENTTAEYDLNAIRDRYILMKLLSKDSGDVIPVEEFAKELINEIQNNENLRQMGITLKPDNRGENNSTVNEVVRSVTRGSDLMVMSETLVNFFEDYEEHILNVVAIQNTIIMIK